MQSLLATTHNTRFLKNGYGVSTHIIRSDTIDKCSESEIKLLKEMSVNYVIDLRNPKNKSTNSYLAKYGIHLLSYPLPPKANSGLLIKANSDQDYCLEYYLFLLQQLSTVKEILQTIGTIDGRVLIYCALGRDRTGIVAFIIQMLVRVDYSAIVEDFALSDNMLLNLITGKEHPLQFKMDYEMALRRAEKLIDRFNNLYGSAERYLNLMGFSTTEVLRLIRKLDKMLFGNM